MSTTPQALGFAANPYDSRHSPFANFSSRLPLLLAVVALHAVIFYMIHHGMLQRAVSVVLPRVLYANILPAAIPKPPPAPAVPEKTVKASSNQPQKALPPINHPVMVALTVPADTPVSNTATTNPVTETVATASKEPTAAPPAPTAPTQPKLITSGVQYLHPPQPQYPPVSKRLGEQGKVMLRVLINDKGRPEQVDIAHSSGFTRLDQAARAAVLNALFSPYLENGKAITVFAVVPIVFELEA